ncbi:MAG: tweety protein, partial [Hominenteromicrobium sp.]
MNLCFVFCHRQLSSIHENSQTEGVGNEVRQRASKDL